MDINQIKEKLPLVGLCVLLFTVGFGTGRAQKRMPNNYNGNAEVKQTANNAAGDTPAGADDPSTLVDGKCLIKGNISGKNKIYHVAGGRFYKTVKPEQCFATEAAAKAGGFRKSQQ